MQWVFKVTELYVYIYNLAEATYYHSRHNSILSAQPKSTDTIFYEYYRQCIPTMNYNSTTLKTITITVDAT